MLAFAVPPGYRRSKPRPRPKLDAFAALIDQILEADRSAPPKQRHTAKRIYERLRAEHGYTGSYTTVKDYVRARRHRRREVFVPLAHPPGHAQVDFGEAMAVIGGERRKVHLFCLDLPHWDACFVKAYPAERIEAFLDGHNAPSPSSAACRTRSSTTTPSWRWPGSWAAASGGGPGPSPSCSRTTCSSTASAGPAKATTRARWKAWSAMPGATSWSRSRLASFAALNAHLEQSCLSRLSDQLRGQTECIGERLERDLAALQPRPAVPFDACDRRPARSPRSRSCATSATTTRCRPPTATARCWCAATSRRW